MTYTRLEVAVRQILSLAAGFAVGFGRGDEVWAFPLALSGACLWLALVASTNLNNRR